MRQEEDVGRGERWCVCVLGGRFQHSAITLEACWRGNGKTGWGRGGAGRQRLICSNHHLAAHRSARLCISCLCASAIVHLKKLVHSLHHLCTFFFYMTVILPAWWEPGVPSLFVPDSLNESSFVRIQRTHATDTQSHTVCSKQANLYKIKYLRLLITGNHLNLGYWQLLFPLR